MLMIVILCDASYKDEGEPILLIYVRLFQADKPPQAVSIGILRIFWAQHCSSTTRIDDPTD